MCSQRLCTASMENSFSSLRESRTKERCSEARQRQAWLSDVISKAGIVSAKGAASIRARGNAQELDHRLNQALKAPFKPADGSRSQTWRAIHTDYSTTRMCIKRLSLSQGEDEGDGFKNSFNASFMNLFERAPHLNPLPATGARRRSAQRC